MAKDFADRAMVRRNSRGALVTKMPASGSSLPGGSPVTIGKRKRINRARDSGRAILVRATDRVCVRVATFDEIYKSLKSYDGRILAADVIDVDGDYGALCVVDWLPASCLPRPRVYDGKPRLVKHAKR